MWLAVLFFGLMALGCFGDVIKHKRASGELNLFALCMTLFFAGLSAIFIYKIFA